MLATLDTSKGPELPKTKLKEEFKHQLRAFVENGNAEKVARLADLVHVLEPACAAVRDTIKDLIDAGQGDSVPGWEIKEKRIRRKVNILDVYRIVNETLTDEEFAACASIKWGELEDHYTHRLQLEAEKRGEKLPKKTAKEMLSKLLEPFSEFGVRRELRRKK
jgi:hypothetical protein